MVALPPKTFKCTGNVGKIQELCFYFGEIDFIQSCSVVSTEFGYVRPIIQDEDITENKTEDTDNSFIDVKDIRHPLIEQINKDVQYVANDICLGKEKENWEMKVEGKGQERERKREMTGKQCGRKGKGKEMERL